MENQCQKEALLIMFGQSWSKKYELLDGQDGRPSIADCIEKALYKNTKQCEDLVDFVERHLSNTARRYQRCR
jgi:hypothetical protein